MAGLRTLEHMVDSVLLLEGESDESLRTLMVAIAGSIGIIGIALILGLSNGVNQFIKDTEEGRESWLKERLEQVKAWRGHASEE